MGRRVQPKKALFQFCRAFVRDESAQGMTEYILLLGMTSVIAATLAKRMLALFDRGILKLGAVLEKDLKSGRAPLGTWSN